MAVLDPARTAVEKLMLLHAAVLADAERRLSVARHYDDVWCLPADCRITEALSEPLDVATMARDVETFTHAAGLPSRGRPREEFAASEAFDSDETATELTRAAYDTVVLGSLLWPNSPRPTFQECLRRCPGLPLRTLTPVDAAGDRAGARCRVHPSMVTEWSQTPCDPL